MGTDNTDGTTGTAVDATPTLPFTIPADYTGLSDADLSALISAVREHATVLAGTAPAEITADTVDALRTCRDVARQATEELSGRAARVDAAASLAEEIRTATAALDTGPDADADSDGDGGHGDPDPAPALTAAPRRPAPTVAQVARTAPPAQLPPQVDRSVFASMTASADVPGFASGQRLEAFADAARALAARLDQYPTMTAGRARQVDPHRRPITVYDPDAGGRVLEMRNYTRHSAVQFRRHFPPELTVPDGGNGFAVAEYAANERRLPGGSLRESARLAVKAGRSLTAAAGWCAPSETIYDLCELETLDGILDLPELQTSRGGWQIPINGGPDFSSIYTTIGNAGVTHITEAGVISDTTKYCTDIPCPSFEDIRLGVDYFCLTGGLLQRRGYPEMVARFGRGAVIALAHKINQTLIATLVAASGPATVIPADPSGDDAISSLFSAVDLAIEDAKNRNRMSFASTLEVVLPHWVLVQIRAAGTRRSGVDMVGITDAQILEWFAIRKAVPRFVVDWQDSFSGLVGGPGAANPLTALPLTVQFLIYPAGTWVKAVQDVVSLDTIYDSTKLATNEYTAVFTEDGWAALQMCATSRLYTVPVDPSGVIACCPSAYTS